MRSLGSSTVLVVDDERNMRDMLEIGLTQHGFIVTSAPGGVEALALLARTIGIGDVVGHVFLSGSERVVNVDHGAVTF